MRSISCRRHSSYWTYDPHSIVVDYLRRWEFKTLTINSQPNHQSCSMITSNGERVHTGYTTIIHWLRYTQCMMVEYYFITLVRCIDNDKAHPTGSPCVIASQLGEKVWFSKTVPENRSISNFMVLIYKGTVCYKTAVPENRLSIFNHSICHL